MGNVTTVAIAAQATMPVIIRDKTSSNSVSEPSLQRASKQEHRERLIVTHEPICAAEPSPQQLPEQVELQQPACSISEEELSLAEVIAFHQEELQETDEPVPTKKKGG